MKTCQNSSTLGAQIIAGGCFSGLASVLLTVRYNEVEAHTLRLCEACAGAVNSDAKRRGFKTNKKRIK